MTTRSSSKKAPSLDEIGKKIKDSSSLSSEAKSIFQVLLDFMKTMINARDSKVSELENLLEAEKNDNNAKLSAMESELTQYKSENKNLASQLTKMTHSHDELEAYGRRESLIFSGDKIKPFESNKNCVHIAKSMIQNTLKMNLDPLISTAHRMGKPPAPDSNRPDKRAIIVKFIRRDDKFNILKTARAEST